MRFGLTDLSARMTGMSAAHAICGSARAQADARNCDGAEA